MKVNSELITIEETEDQGKDNTVKDIDNDITSNVLSRLPTKTLFGLKLVSKEWHHLMLDRSFIRLQLKSTEALSGFFFQGKFQWCGEDIQSVHYIPAKADVTKLHSTVLNFLPEPVVVHSSVHGLICCRSCFPSQNPIIYVCNPVNKEWVSLPYPESDFQDSLALGFDPFVDPIDVKTNFKVIRVYEVEADMDNMDDIRYSFDIYSSQTGTWRKAVEICQCSSHLCKNKGLFVKGIFYWLTGGDKILMFDVKNEFSLLITVPLPLTQFNSIPEMCIGECDGRLHYVLISEHGLQLWVLEEQYTSQWDLKCSISLDKFEEENRVFAYNVREKITGPPASSPWIDPLVFKDGMLLMKITTDIFLFDFEAVKLKRLCSLYQLGPNSSNSSIVLPYTMSLVPLDYL
ncbi:putative F-box protein At4g10190 [Daucus carota subsp. sativus]|uniref:F-box domain-containing protein n=2 Tax=Daucus carota subsp. sativus TaxID=79200 RepID=A0A162AAC7_DAUCS|nr:PREDICTED: putative F-box protein At4g10190 isoform X2 [Daucus carota subsp. sativus]XP_017245220.1 PREDICTED: putative F-box protein At4g10190 isoform X2 [Daucus carota subsp. sativus]XP_017245221.1 PREDICTED: putative F-box protein At4g10190 isoform X2 [Daucus carota subsp. sativus]